MKKNSKNAEPEQRSYVYVLSGELSSKKVTDRYRELTLKPTKRTLMVDKNTNSVSSIPINAKTIIKTIKNNNTSVISNDDNQKLYSTTAIISLQDSNDENKIVSLSNFRYNDDLIVFNSSVDALQVKGSYADNAVDIDSIPEGQVTIVMEHDWCLSYPYGGCVG